MAGDPLRDNSELAALHRAEAVTERRRAQAAVRAIVGRAIGSDGRVRLGNPDAYSGVLPPGGGGTGHERGAEPPLGNPDTDGELLTSTAAGARSWVAFAALLGTILLGDLGDVTTDDAAQGDLLTYWEGAWLPLPPQATEPYGVAFRNDGFVALRSDGQIATKAN